MFQPKSKVRNIYKLCSAHLGGFLLHVVCDLLLSRIRKKGFYMPITLLGGCYNVPNAIKVYHHRNGEVYITRGDEFYAVHVVKKTTPYSEHYKLRGRLDALAAGDFFDIACRWIRDEIEWTEPVRKFSCKYNPNRSRGCTDKNCPRALGGKDYRYIFGASCPFRKTPHTR